MAKREVQWDRHEILAAVRRRGTNLRKLAISAGLSESGCRAALCKPGFKTAEKVISDFLGEPIFVLWPDRYPGVAIKQREHKRSRPARTSPNDVAA